MKYSDLIKKIRNVSEDKGSSDESTAIREEQKEIVGTKITIRESFTQSQAVKAIRRHSSEKITNSLVEKCIAAASSKELTNNPFVLEMRKEDQHKINDKYIFVLENNDIIALSEEVIETIKHFSDEEIKEATQSADRLKELLER